MHSKSSIGIGGHISTLDENSNDPYLVGMQRELDEEVAIDSEFEVQCVGLINDDSNEVGRVHLALCISGCRDAGSDSPRRGHL